MNNNNEDKIEIKFKLNEVSKLKFYENDPDEIGLEDIRSSEVKTGINTQLDISNKDETIAIILNVSFSKASDLSKKLFGIKTKHVYQIQKFAEVLHRVNENDYNIPNNLLATFVSIAYSGTRGMLSVLVTNDKYKRIILPVVNPNALLPNKHSK